MLKPSEPNILTYFILPKKDNKGKSLKELHKDLIIRLTMDFGGVTFHNVKGCWLNEETNKILQENNRQYILSFKPTDENMLKFTRVLIDVKKLAKQDAIFFAIGSNAGLFI